MTNSLVIQQILKTAITSSPGTFLTPADWITELSLDEPRGKVRLCLEHLCDAGDIQRQIKIDWRNAPFATYGVRP